MDLLWALEHWSIERSFSWEGKPFSPIDQSKQVLPNRREFDPIRRLSTDTSELMVWTELNAISSAVKDAVSIQLWIKPSRKSVRAPEKLWKLRSL